MADQGPIHVLEVGHHHENEEISAKSVEDFKATLGHGRARDKGEPEVPL
jgi:hypothetical protein